ncbi:MAG: replicative DNA helicase [Mycoplasma sp.]|nr:replicative DNA helicase [Candidatus Hennigella equi]
MAKEKVENYIVKCEQEVLTTIFNNPISIEECLTALEQKDFLDDKNALIYGAIVEIYLGHLKTINKNTVTDYIANNSKWQFTNWQSYLEQLISGFAFEDDLKANLELIKNASIKRQLDNFSQRVINTKIDFAQYDNQIAQLENEFMDITQSKHTDKLTPIEEVAAEYLDRVSKLRQRKQDITGTAIGFKGIDQVTNGFQPGDLIILAARPGVGKTAIALNFANNAATTIKENMTSEKDRVVIFSLEMGQEQLCQRLVSLNSKVESSALRSGRMSDSEWTEVQSSIEELKTLPILIDDQAVSIVDIQSKLKQLKSQYNIKLVIIDYLQLMKGPAIKNSQVNRQQEVSTISRMIKLLARRIDAPIIALAQLSRDVEKRGGTPKLSDLRESGSLEQDADLVCFLHHADETAEQEGPVQAAGPKEKPDVIRVDFMIAKHRNGAQKTIALSMNRRTGRFYDFTDLGDK